MKQRITYLLQNADALDQNSLGVKDRSLQIKHLQGAKEHRLSLGIHELPPELKSLLEQSQELHVRWISQENYTAVAPFVARLSPGLHVFFTPQSRSPADRLCPCLKAWFAPDVKCSSAQDSFTRIPMLSERFSSATALQFHHLLPSLDHFVSYIQKRICKDGDSSCLNSVSSLQSTSYLDIDYDAISHVLSVNAFWPSALQLEGWTERLENAMPEDKIEVGVLGPEKATTPEELSLGGYLTVVGEDEKPAATLFSFPSRHHPYPEALYTVSLPFPTGLHPTLRISLFPSSLPPPSESCALHTYLTLPSYLFADQYQLSDPLFLASRNIRHVRTIYGETNLENPDWVIDNWGSALLLEILSPSEDQHSNDKTHHPQTIDIPLHLRYLTPKHGTHPHRQVQVPWPVVFWACDADDGLKMAVNPFDRRHLGYDVLFGPKTMFYHWQPQPPPSNRTSTSTPSTFLLETLDVPVLDLDGARYVEFATVLVVLLGFVWVCWKLLILMMMTMSSTPVISKKARAVKGTKKTS